MELVEEEERIRKDKKVVVYRGKEWIAAALDRERLIIY